MGIFFYIVKIYYKDILLWNLSLILQYCIKNYFQSQTQIYNIGYKKLYVLLMWKKMKLISWLTRYLNAYISQPLRIQPNRDNLILIEDDNTSDYFMHHNKEKYLLGNNGQDVKED